MKENEPLYNVYAWHKGGHAILVAKDVKSITEANDIVEIYLNRGLDWDAYAVSQEDDPGYIPEDYAKHTAATEGKW